MHLRGFITLLLLLISRRLLISLGLLLGRDKPLAMADSAGILKVDVRVFARESSVVALHISGMLAALIFQKFPHGHFVPSY
jgi:hypothetical protein